jgi:hypothetical protein
MQPDGFSPVCTPEAAHLCSTRLSWSCGKTQASVMTVNANILRYIQENTMF